MLPKTNASPKPGKKDKNMQAKHTAAVQCNAILTWIEESNNFKLITGSTGFNKAVVAGNNGAAQILAGQWEFAAGNTFEAMAFTLYGGFWLSFATIFIPGFNILGLYDMDTIVQLPDALRIYLMK
ncbi:hypothetical protein HK100_010719 [Physocladia obscura]|uniref:Uncharacterized protein n=1 Tax=Physocladia obscura TaxID=109957 RepID=A0AAD5SM46_9FUNG|nr:hypothetical protein HK100_010719 [Physocladia obscura]